MILGISTTKSAVIIAKTRGAGGKFVITGIKPLPFQVRSGDDLAGLLQSLMTLFDRKGMGAAPVIALLKCSSGRFGSCLEAIKGEAMIELAAVQRGWRVDRRRGCEPCCRQVGENLNSAIPRGRERSYDPYRVVNCELGTRKSPSSHL